MLCVYRLYNEGYRGTVEVEGGEKTGRGVVYASTN